MQVYLYNFTSLIDAYWVTNDNINHVINGVTYLACAIESKEVVLDLKEIMGECTVTMPWEQAGYLTDCIQYPYDSPVVVDILSYDTSAGTTAMVFAGFVNSVKGSQCQVELSCISFVEHARDNFPRMVVTRLCNHRLYSSLCTMEATNWTDNGSLISATKDRLGFYVGTVASHDENWYRYGYVFYGNSYRWVTYNSTNSGNVVYFEVMHPIPPGWVTDSPLYLVAGCDKMMRTCKDKFDNFIHYLGFPHAPYEMIRLTGLKSTEVYQEEGGKGS